MIKLYTWCTQNARKISIMLEECGADYELIPVNLIKDEQKSAEFLKLNPNGKIPALLDTAPIDPEMLDTPVFETGSMLLYLAERYNCFLPKQANRRTTAINWLFWQCSGLGPTLGNFSHFASAMVEDKTKLNEYLVKTRSPQKEMYSIQRFSQEALRLFSVLNTQLEGRDYIAEEISIADFAAYPWIETVWSNFKMIAPAPMSKMTNIEAWLERMNAREGVKVGMEKLAYGKW